VYQAFSCVCRAADSFSGRRRIVLVATSVTAEATAAVTGGKEWDTSAAKATAAMGNQNFVEGGTQDGKGRYSEGKGWW
jgi:hypothetical protein